jgi:hypothetical protein
MASSPRTAGSFRDPSGFVFERDGVLLRQVNRSYQEQYDQLMASGLYKKLADDCLLISHLEGDDEPLDAGTSYKVLRPDPVPFISYPYEWSFSQLQDAALLTLAVQRRALECGMSLKDATAYNIQFNAGRPIFIDTLSFELYRAGEPWGAYRQFCQHFLAPLALMSLTDIRLNQLCRSNIDGIPLDLASRLLPWKSRVSFSLGLHLHVHAKFQAVGANGAGAGTRSRGRFGRNSLLGLLDSLEAAVRRLRWGMAKSTWSNYYQENTYTPAASEQKARLVARYLDQAAPAMVWDLGANTGAYSRLASDRGIPTIAFDLDPSCVERNYLEARRGGETNLLPLLLDLFNPSPSTGWRNEERMSLFDRGPADLVLALALVHHLAIGGNLPLDYVARFFRDVGRSLAIEFVPADDPQAQRLLAAHRGVCHEYGQEAFERSFQNDFDILDSERVPDSNRVLYLMKRREA